MDLFKHKIAEAISKHTIFRTEEIVNLLETPPSIDLGDYAFPCFSLSKQFKKNPNEIAKDLSNKIEKTEIISKIQADGPYLNFFINTNLFIKFVITDILKTKEKYGMSPPKKEKVMIEFSQPNTHKDFHIGHLRNVALGDALVNIFRFNGYKTIPSNYIGDIGNHVAKCIWIYLKKYKREGPLKDKGSWLGDLYVEATKLIEENEIFKEEVQTVQRKLEEGDKEIKRVWKKTREWSLEEFDEIYKLLNIKFDVCFYESEEEKKGKLIANELLKKGIAKLSEGAILIDLEKYKLDKFLILKKDGTSLYSTKDLALAKTKFTKYKIDKSIYVVADEQKFYFQQLFKTLELIGFKQASKCYHIPYALVMLESGKMSSRQGNIIKFKDLYQDVLKYTINETKKRHSKWSLKKYTQIAQKITIAALKFSMLLHDNNKVIIFNKEKAISFEGETGPYVQYTYARITSILNKHKLNIDTKINFSLLSHYDDKLITNILQKYPEIVKKSAAEYKPNIVAHYLIDLCQAFNEYYHKHTIIQEDKDLEKSRISLVYSTKIVIKSGLKLLGIESPNEM